MEKHKKMTKIPELSCSLNNRVYFPESYKNCCQIEFNKDGSADLYDYSTGKHIDRFN